MRTVRVVLGGTLCCALLAWAPVRARGAEDLVEPGKLTVLSDVLGNLPQLPAPRDGRLRGYGFAAEVTGERCASVITGPGVRLATVAGDEVCAFRFTLDYEATLTVTSTGQVVPGFSAHVDAGSTRVAMSENVVNECSDDEYAVAVPDGESATLAMSEADFTQSFSLTAGERTGPSPLALYRSPSGSEVSASPGTAVTLSEASGKHTASMGVALSSLTLSYFMPGDPLVHAAGTDGAFLGLGFKETDETGPGGVKFTDFAPLPGSGLSLTPSGGGAEPGTLVETIALGMFANSYAFDVPADLASGTLRLGPGTREGDEQTAASGQATAHTVAADLVPVRFGSASLPLRVPDPVASGGGPAVTTTTLSPGGGAGVTTTTAAKPISRVGAGHRHDHHGDNKRYRHETKQHDSSTGAVPGGNPATIGLASAPVPDGTKSDLAPVVATSAAAGGTTLIVIPLLIVWRRRRIGSRLSIRFPRARPERPDDPDDPDDGTQPVAEVLANDVEAAVAVVEPPGGEAADDVVLAVRVLGPVEVEGLERIDGHFAQVVELCVYLVMNGGRLVTSEELRINLGKETSDWSAKTLYNRVVSLRKGLGNSVLVKAGGTGYRLEGAIRSDWAEFCQLTSDRAAGTTAREERLTQALGLVRGAPFSSIPAGQYAWALSGGTANEMTVAIENAALDLATIHIDAGRAREAAGAARAGLRAAPYSLGLLSLLLRAGAIEGRIGLESAWREVSRLAGDDEELRVLKERLEVEIVRA